MALMSRTELYWGALAERLQVERARRGWTAEHLAARAGLGSKATVLGAETGTRKPSKVTILRLEAAFGLPEGELLHLLNHGPDAHAPTDEHGRAWVRANQREAMRILMDEINGGAQATDGL